MPYLIGEVVADSKSLLARTPEQLRRRNGIEVRVRHEVTGIDPVGGKLAVRDIEGDHGYEEHYDNLIIATGANPFIPPIDGVELDGVFHLRNFADGIAIKEYIESRKPASAAVVGAGPIGLEMVEALGRRGLKVHLIEMADRVMPLLDSELGEKLKDHLEEQGVEVHLPQRLESLEGDGNGVLEAITDREKLSVDLVIIGIGIRPEARLAESAGITLGAKGAIRVDDHMRTSIEGIYACGDCATSMNRVTGREVWIPMGSTARKQGRVAGENAVGGDRSFPGVLGTSIVKSFDLTMARTGLSAGEAREEGFDPAEVTVSGGTLPGYFPGGGSMTMKVICEEPDGRVLGAQMVGRGAVDKRVETLITAITVGMSASQLSWLDLAYAPPYEDATDLVHVAGNLLVSKLEGTACCCTCSELESMRSKGEKFLIVDVRDPMDYRDGHIPGAVNIALEQLSERIDEVRAGGRVVVYGAVTEDTQEALDVLKREGIEDALQLEGGFTAWRGDIEKGD